MNHGRYLLFATRSRAAGQRREREPLLVGVEQVETMRLYFLAHDDLRSAALLSLLAYAGPRPESEALPLRWSAVRKHTILFRATKRGVADILHFVEFLYFL